MTDALQFTFLSAACPAWRFAELEGPGHKYFYQFIYSFILLWVRGALLPFSVPPTNLAWQILGFLDALSDSQTLRGCTANTALPPPPRGGPSLNLASLPELVLFRAPWGRGWAVAYGFELANAQTRALVPAPPRLAV